MTMYRNAAGALAAVLIAVIAGCASSGLSLSSSSYRAEDFAAAQAGAQYDNLYDFLRAHSRVRVGSSGATTPLAVRDRGGGGVGADFQAPERDTSRSLGGGGASGGYVGGPNTANYAPALLYIGEQNVGSPIPRLRQISPSQVESLEILRPSEASSRYGGDGRVAIIDLRLKGQDGS